MMNRNIFRVLNRIVFFFGRMIVEHMLFLSQDGNSMLLQNQMNYIRQFFQVWKNQKLQNEVIDGKDV